jgi:hypothetical protein
MRIRRLPVADELMIDDELVVLVDDTVLVLSGVASTALDHLVTGVWTTSEALTAHLAASVGLPEGGASAVSSLVSELEDARLVTVER